MGARSAALDALGNDFSWSLLEAAPDGMLIVDRRGEIVFVSDQAAALFGCTDDELLGRTVEELVPDDVRSTHRAHRTRYPGRADRPIDGRRPAAARRAGWTAPSSRSRSA